MCPICLDADLEDGTMLTTSCSHRFCASLAHGLEPIAQVPALPRLRPHLRVAPTGRGGLAAPGSNWGRRIGAARERDRREDRLMKGYLVSVAHAPNAPATR